MYTFCSAIQSSADSPVLSKDMHVYYTLKKVSRKTQWILAFRLIYRFLIMINLSQLNYDDTFEQIKRIYNHVMCIIIHA